LLKFLVGGSACESRAEVDVFRDLHGHKIKKANKGVMATGTSRSAWLVIRSPARLVPAPYPQRSRTRRAGCCQSAECM
jgi:hypothetical protein